jgi:hypothetical protein
MDAREDQPSVAALVKDLVGETGVLIRQELNLARTEMTSKAKSAIASGAMVFAGALLGHAALLTAVAAAVLALGTVMPLWAGGLMSAAVLAIIAAVVVSTGLGRLRKLDPMPDQTIASLKHVASVSDGRVLAKEQSR